MDADLITHVRSLLQDSTLPYLVADTQIENLAKNRRVIVYYESLTTDDYLTWYYKPYMEVTALSASYEGAALTGYTKDTVEGSVTFATKQSAVYLRGYQYDLMDVIAYAWLAKAGALDSFPGLTYSLGDESVNKAEGKEYCIEQYWRFRTSEGGQLSRS